VLDGCAAQRRRRSRANAMFSDVNRREAGNERRYQERKEL